MLPQWYMSYRPAIYSNTNILLAIWTLRQTLLRQITLIMPIRMAWHASIQHCAVQDLLSFFSSNRSFVFRSTQFDLPPTIGFVKQASLDNELIFARASCLIFSRNQLITKFDCAFSTKTWLLSERWSKESFSKENKEPFLLRFRKLVHLIRLNVHTSA